MSALKEANVRVVLYGGEGTSSLESDEKFQLIHGLLDQGYGVTCASDGAVAPADQSHLLVLGRFGDRQVEADSDQSEREVRFRNLETTDVREVSQWVEDYRAEKAAPAPGAWKPWFPVIDYDRCTNCMQCLSFCLFGVYGVDTGQTIQVQNNDNCKTNCPACSRVCPEAAIMFPKYKAGPINGAPVSQEDLQREKMKVDISALLGGDIYDLLRERSAKAKSRFSKERDSDKALKERQKCLVKLQQAGDIPAEVLMSLPSPEEIARRAEEAQAKGRAAQEALREKNADAKVTSKDAEPSQ